MLWNTGWCCTSKLSLNWLPIDSLCGIFADMDELHCTGDISFCGSLYLDIGGAEEDVRIVESETFEGCTSSGSVFTELFTVSHCLFVSFRSAHGGLEPAMTTPCSSQNVL